MAEISIPQPHRSLLARMGQGWTRFWFTPSDPIVLSVIRVLTGFVAIWWYLTLYGTLQAWFGPNGLLPASIAQQIRINSDTLQEGRFAISVLDGVDTASQLWFVYGLGFVAIAMLFFGLFSRITSIASLLFVLMFIHRAPMAARPVDNILVLLLLYLCIGPSGAYFSIDAMLKRRKLERERPGMPLPASAPFSSFATVAIRLIQIHLALIYGAMVAAQLQIDAWWQGTAVWWMMAQPETRLFDMTGLASKSLTFEYFIDFCTHAITLYEICFAVFIWNPLVRPILLVLGVLVWFGIALVSGSLSFSLAMLVGSLAFASPETLQSVFSTGVRGQSEPAVRGTIAAG